MLTSLSHNTCCCSYQAPNTRTCCNKKRLPFSSAYNKDKAGAERKQQVSNICLLEKWERPGQRPAASSPVTYRWLFWKPWFRAAVSFPHQHSVIQYSWYYDPQKMAVHYTSLTATCCSVFVLFFYYQATDLQIIATLGMKQEGRLKRKNLRQMKRRTPEKGNWKKERIPEYKTWLLRIRLIGVTYYLPLVSMTAAITFGKWLYLVHDTATSPTGDKINIPQHHWIGTHKLTSSIYRCNIQQRSLCGLHLGNISCFSPQTGRKCDIM